MKKAFLTYINDPDDKNNSHSVKEQVIALFEERKHTIIDIEEIAISDIRFDLKCRKVEENKIQSDGIIYFYTPKTFCDSNYMAEMIQDSHVYSNVIIVKSDNDYTNGVMTLFDESYHPILDMVASNGAIIVDGVEGLKHL